MTPTCTPAQQSRCYEQEAMDHTIQVTVVCRVFWHTPNMVSHTNPQLHSTCDPTIRTEAHRVVADVKGRQLAKGRLRKLHPPHMVTHSAQPSHAQ